MQLIWIKTELEKRNTLNHHNHQLFHQQAHTTNFSQQPLDCILLKNHTEKQFGAPSC